MIERYFYIIEYCTLICTLIDSIIVLTETEKMPNPNLSTVEIQPILLFVLWNSLSIYAYDEKTIHFSTKGATWVIWSHTVLWDRIE